MAAGDGAAFWRHVRWHRGYREAWRDHGAAAARAVRWEDAPFPVRLRSQADLAAEAAWGLLAWADPDGPALSPFLARAPMLDGVGSRDAAPLLPLLARAGAAVEGLRLADGALVLKVERRGRAVQVRLTRDDALMAGGGVRLFHDWGMQLPVSIERLEDVWSVSGGGARPEGIGWRGAGTRVRC